MELNSSDEAPEGRINEHLRFWAKHHAVEAIELVQDVLWRECGEFRLANESSLNLAGEFFRMFMHAGKMGAVNTIIDPHIRRKLERAHPYRAGKRSGEVRGARGHKHSARAWVDEARKVNPTLSKNEAARLYALQHPGTSVSTIRRYLAIADEFLAKGEDGTV